MAASEDLFYAYERAVQDPEGEVAFVSRTFKRLRKRTALTLREDFCGSAAFSAQWVRSKKGRMAWGVDCDAPTLAWAQKHRVETLPPSSQAHLELVKADVRQHGVAAVDVAVAYNFSYWIFKKREEMLSYFRAAKAGLVEDGLFFLDIMGGSDVTATDETVNNHEDFIYFWRHESFNPINNDLRCSISFEFRDGSCLRPAFAYDWRLWTIPELRDVLEEAGFSKVRVYWEQEDEDGEGTGNFRQAKKADNEGIWWAYIVAEA